MRAVCLDSFLLKEAKNANDKKVLGVALCARKSLCKRLRKNCISGVVFVFAFSSASLQNQMHFQCFL